MAAEERDAGLLVRLLALMEATGPLRINLEDYLGVLSDIPGLAVPERFYRHECGFCMLAKGSRRGFADCFANKRAINRLLQHRKRPFHGLCHLGVTDLVHPVMVAGVCVAGVYYGSVLVRGTEAAARRRVRAYCRRRGISARPYLEAQARLPRIGRNEIGVYAERLRLVVDLIARLVDESGIPLSRYRQEKDAEAARKRAGLPMVLQSALRVIERSYPQRVTRAGVAKQIHCNANYLSGLFTAHLGMGFTPYLNRVRVERAKTLLRNTGQTAGEIAFAVGFEGQSYFNRVFKRATGMTPVAFRARTPSRKSAR